MLKYLEEIKEIEKKYFNCSFLDLENTNRKVLIKEIDNNLASYLIYNFVLDEAEIISVYTKEKYQNLGLATSLIESLKQKYCNIFLEVNENNIKAYNLYIKLGFIVYGNRPKYYNNKDMAILMKWSR